ncbi:MAG: hypothetical protein IKZ59_00795, partial [Clostridia bacterium]|nr:hypothetical protein [Clostridia bacterium]
AFEYAREALGSATIINEDDGHYQHANRYGQYIEGCCYVAKIFGIEIAADTFVSHPYVNDGNFVATLTSAANDAVTYYNVKTGSTNGNGTIEDDDLAEMRKNIIADKEVRPYEINVYDYVHLKSYLVDTKNVTVLR